MRGHVVDFCDVVACLVPHREYRTSDLRTSHLKVPLQPANNTRQSPSCRLPTPHSSRPPKSSPRLLGIHLSPLDKKDLHGTWCRRRWVLCDGRCVMGVRAWKGVGEWDVFGWGRVTICGGKTSWKWYVSSVQASDHPANCQLRGQVPCTAFRRASRSVTLLVPTGTFPHPISGLGPFR